MVDLVRKKSFDCNDLVEIVRILRAPGGCQWDQAQTHESIRRNFLEEAYEVAEAIDEGSTEHLKEELGDLLFAVVNAARFLKVDPEDALHAAIDKFSARFRRVEEAAATQGRRMENMTLAEMDRLWDEVKHKA